MAERNAIGDDGTYREQYYEYLASRAFKLLRRQVMERANGICERCHREPVYAVHHKTYLRAFHEDPADLVALGFDCHEWETGTSDYDPLDAPSPDPAPNYLLDGVA